jgi:2-polyprenyl-3-methyl-5-hydroxy-6-metoxy-1,4-benzoquinol methylase
MDLVERRQSAHERHPWETARAVAIESIVRQLGLVAPSVLDVGCGDGYLVTVLQQRLELGDVVAQDIHLTDDLIRELSGPGATFVRELDRVSSRANLVLLLDVLEHVEQPEALLREIASDRLAPGGHVLITVPAFQALFTRHDRALRHHRRYSQERLAREVAAAGLCRLDSGYLFASLLVPRALGALAERLRPAERAAGAAVKGVGDWSAPAFVTKLLHQALTLDNRFCLAARARGVTVPGLSIWLTCRAPS